MEVFDPRFRKTLEEVVMSDRLPANMCHALKLDNNTRFIKSTSLREFIYKLSRSSLKWFCDFSRINLLNDSPRIIRPTFRQKLYLILNDQTRTTTKRWPSVLLTVYLMCMVFVMYNTYFIYIYDANKFKLQKLQAYLSDPYQRDRLINELHLDVGKLLSEFSHRAKEARKKLKQLSCPYLEFSYIATSSLMLLVQTLDWILGFPLRIRLGNSVWFSAKALLDQDNERQTRLELILGELEQFKLDCWSYFSVRHEKFYRDLAINSLDLAQREHGSPRPQSLKKKNTFDMVIDKVVWTEKQATKLHYKHTLRQLIVIALEGRLNSLNRTPSCRDKLALVYSITLLSILFYTHLFIIGLHYWSITYHARLGKPAEMDSYRSVFNFASVGVLFEMAYVMASFDVSLMVTTIYDHLGATGNLHTIIKQTIKLNERRCNEMLRLLRQTTNDDDDDVTDDDGSQYNPFASPFRTGQPKLVTGNYPAESARRHHQARGIELDLLTIVIHCRLLTKAFVMVKEPVGKIASLMIVYAISTPVVFCIHSAYFTYEVKLLSLSFSLAASMCILFILALLGCLYKRNIEVFGTVWSLVAQLSYFETLPGIRQQLQLDSGIALFSLRRQLADMQFAMDKLAIKWLTMPITYINLIRIFTWILIFMMAGSILSVRLFGEGLGSIMSDPFGLYNFAKG